MARGASVRRARRDAETLGRREVEREMVLYEAMILVSAKAPRTACADILRRLGANVMERGGVVTDVTSYGARTLAYEFRRPGETHFEVRVMRGEGEGRGGRARGRGGRGRGRATRVRSAETREREGVCEVEGRWGGRFGDACVCCVCARLTVMGVNRARARRRNS